MATASRSKVLMWALVAAWPFGTSSIQAATLSVSPGAQTVGLGASTFIDIAVTGLGDGVAPSLGAYDLNVNYDSTLLSFISATLGDPALGNQLDLFNLVSNPSAVDGTLPNTVNVFELSFDSVANLNTLQAANFTLFRLTFSAVKLGNSPIAISINSLANAAGDSLAANVVGSNVTVSAVPAPAAGWLMVTGILSIGVRVARRNRSGRADHRGTVKRSSFDS